MSGINSLQNREAKVKLSGLVIEKVTRLEQRALVHSAGQQGQRDHSLELTETSL
jgi:hypothetical protein